MKVRAAVIILAVLCGCIGTGTEKKMGGAGFIDKIDGGPFIPADADTLLVKNFNCIPGREAVCANLTRRVISRISMDGRLSAGGKNFHKDPDLVLNCALTSFDTQVTEFDPARRPLKKRLRLTASAALLDVRSKRPVFYDREIQFFREYSDIVPPLISDRKAAEEAIDGLADRIASKVIKGWYTEYLTRIEKGKK